MFRKTAKPHSAAYTISGTTRKVASKAVSAAIPNLLQPRRRETLLASTERLDLDEVWVPFRWPGQLGGNQVYLSGSWCDWKENHTPLVECGTGPNNYPGDWVAMYKMKVGQHEYKFNIDGSWKVAPGDPLVMDPEGNINNTRLCVKNCHVQFSLKSGLPATRAQQTSVSVVGSWSNWKVATPMQKEGSNAWMTELSLPPGSDYYFRFLVDDPHSPAPHVAVSDRYDVAEVFNIKGDKVPCNKISVGMPPAFYLYYATGWRRCTIMYKLLKDGQAMAMDDSPSRAQPSGDNSRWKQVIVGTKIWYLPDGMRAFQDPTEVEWIEDKHWALRLDDGWDLKLALSCAGEMLKVYNRDGPENVKWLDKGQEHPHRVALQVNVSVLDKLIGRLQAMIDTTKLQARIIISGAGDWRYLDVVHKLAGKLEALEWVRQVYNVPVARCVTAGDSCNDILMLDGAMPAIIVGNAQEELVRWYHEQNDKGRIVLTDKPEATGVLEGLARHGLYG
eukprot:gene8536-8718_t